MFWELIVFYLLLLWGVKYGNGFCPQIDDSIDGHYNNDDVVSGVKVPCINI